MGENQIYMKTLVSEKMVYVLGKYKKMLPYIFYVLMVTISRKIEQKQNKLKPCFHFKKQLELVRPFSLYQVPIPPYPRAPS